MSICLDQPGRCSCTQMLLLAFVHTTYASHIMWSLNCIVQLSSIYPLAKRWEDAGQEAKLCLLLKVPATLCTHSNPHANAGMDCPRVRYPQLNDVVEADLAEQGYQVLTDAGQQVDKVIQLYEVTA